MNSKSLSRSFQTDQESYKKLPDQKPEIEMPPIEQEEQVQAQEQEQPEENLQQETQVADKVETTQTPFESDKEKNLRFLREKAEKLERERDEALKYIQSLQKPTQPQQQEQDQDEITINDNDLVEGKHLSKITKKYKKLEEQLKQYQQQSSETVIETKLKTQFPDFDKVVSKDNVELLRATYPELAQTLNTSTDLYNKAVSAYTMIKKLGIHKEDTFQSDKALAQKNAAKPKPLASIAPQQGDSPLSRANAFANGLTDDLKAQLRKEMEDARRNL